MQNDVLWSDRRRRGVRLKNRATVKQIARDWRSDLRAMMTGQQRRVFSTKKQGVFCRKIE